jgi:ribokinase
MGVVVVGSINLDITARIDRTPEVGETRLAADGWIAPGGKGANQALAARRQGAPTRLIGSVGDDVFREPALALLSQEGVDLTLLPRANRDLAPTLFAPGPAVAPGDVVLISLEIPLEVAAAAARWARRAGARVLVDPAPAPEALPPDLTRVDILMPNQGEAATILGQPVGDVREAKAACRALRQRGAQVGMVKLGSDGVVWATRQGVFYLPAVSVEAVDTTGAGDAFAGVLAAALAEGADLPTAVRRATHAAAIACTRPGAQPSYPTRAEVDRSLARN